MASYSNTNRITGLSGIDTESLISQLMKAESLKYDRLKKNGQKLTWTQDAYRGVADKLKTFQNSFLNVLSPGSIYSSTTFSTKKTSVKVSGNDTNSITANPTVNASPGNYTFELKKLAQRDVYQSTKQLGGVVSSAEDMSFASGVYKKGMEFTISLDGGLEKKITLDEDIVGNNTQEVAIKLRDTLNQKLKDAFGTENGEAKVSVGYLGNKLQVKTLNGHSARISSGVEGSNMLTALKINSGSSTNFDSAKTMGQAFGLDSGSITLNGKTFEYTADTTLDDFMKTVNNSGIGVKMSVDSFTQKLKIEATNTGLENSIKMSENGNFLKNLGFIPKTELDLSEVTEPAIGKTTMKDIGFPDEFVFRVNTMDATGMGRISGDMGVQEFMDLVNGNSAAGIELSYNETTKKLDVKATNGKANVVVRDSTNGNALHEQVIIQNGASGSLGDSFNMVKEDIPAVTRDRRVSDVLGSAASSGSFEINGKTFSYNDEKSINELIDEVNSSDAGVKLVYDAANKKLNIESTVPGIETVSIKDLSGSFMNSLGLASVTSVARDSEFSFNGVSTTRNSNSFTVAGINITANSTADIGKVIDITVNNDTSQTLDYIKKFVEGYNALIGDINGTVEEKRAKSGSYTYYEPLSDEERAAMKEEDIKNWEEKAKQGILNNDNILSGITSSMRSLLYQSVTLDNGKKISLYEIGITTSSNYMDKGKLIIDEGKLAKALEERGDDVMQLFTKTSDISAKDKTSGAQSQRQSENGLAQRLIDVVNGAIGSDGSIAQKAGIKGTLSEFTSDMYYKMRDHDNTLADMIAKLRDKENYYYSMFSKLEASINSSNSQMAYLQAQLG